MPVLSASQTAPVVRQDARLTVRVSVTAAHEVPVPEQAAVLTTEEFNTRVLTANQQLAAPTQSVRLVKAVFKGPATPRAERAPAKPR
jgi:hypothetical protein